MRRLKKVGTTQRVSSYKDASLGKNASKQGRNEIENSREAEVHNVENAAVVMEMDVDSGDNVAEYIVADKEGKKWFWKQLIKSN